MNEELDWGDAAEYIVGQRPTIDPEHVWAVIRELRDPPAKSQEDLARQLMSSTRPDIRKKDVKHILAEWRAYARLAGERDWDE